MENAKLDRGIVYCTIAVVIILVACMVSLAGCAPSSEIVKEIDTGASATDRVLDTWDTLTDDQKKQAQYKTGRVFYDFKYSYKGEPLPPRWQTDPWAKPVAVAPVSSGK